MSDWKEELFEFIRDDYVRDGRNSCIHEYYRETFEQKASVRIKQAFADAKGADAGRADIWSVAISVLAESKIYDRIPSLAEHIEPQRDGETKNAFNKRMAEWLHGPAVEAVPEWKTLCAICADIVSETRSKKGVCDHLMEYRADRRAGEHALGDAAEQQWLLDDVRARGKKGKPIPALAADRPGEGDIVQAIADLINDRAEELLYDIGKRVGGGSQHDVARVDDVPTQLIEKCLRKDPNLVARFSRVATLGSTHDSGSARIDEREVAQLYISLLQCGKRPIIVPVAIDAASGLGLYVATPSMIDGEECGSDLLRRMFGEPSAHIPENPFFAIMYNYDNPSECFFRQSEFDRESDDSDPAVIRSMWDSTVAAFRFTGGHGGSDLAFMRALKDYIEKALGAFRDRCRLGTGLQAFCTLNGEPPKGCPESYTKYFQEDMF